LIHQNDSSQHRCKTRQYKVQEYVRERVERFDDHHEGVDSKPQSQNAGEDDNETPASAEIRYLVSEPFSPRQMLVEFNIERTDALALQQYQQLIIHASHIIHKWLRESGNVICARQAKSDGQGIHCSVRAIAEVVGSFASHACHVRQDVQESLSSTYATQGGRAAGESILVALQLNNSTTSGASRRKRDSFQFNKHNRTFKDLVVPKGLFNEVLWIFGGTALVKSSL
jgi:hypothetical protein